MSVCVCSKWGKEGKRRGRRERGVGERKEGREGGRKCGERGSVRRKWQEERGQERVEIENVLEENRERGVCGRG